jgi:hypothetical protein
MPQQIGAEKMRELAEYLSSQIPGLGFCLLVFEFGEGEGKYSNYISNAQREDMTTALEETAHRLRIKTDFKTPERN